MTNSGTHFPTDQVLNETLTEEPDFNLHDGAALARRFFNRTTVIDGIPIYVDEVGERKTDMDIKQFNRDTGEFEVLYCAANFFRNWAQFWL